MITLHGSCARFGLPSASQFVTKAEVLLKMAGVAYTHVDGDFKRAPKGKIPFIETDGKLLGDTEFIRRHLETRHGVDFDAGLSPAERAVATAFAALCDEHLYWAVVHARWMNSANFDRGPRQFFNGVPAPMRPFVVAMVRRNVRQNLRGHGLGRHDPGEIEALARRDIDAISAFLADKPYLMGAEPCSGDASVWPCVVSVLSPHFTSPMRDYAEGKPNLVAYSARGMARWFPELVRAGG